MRSCSNRSFGVKYASLLNPQPTRHYQPATHFQTSAVLEAEAGSPQAATEALKYTFFHWGLHPWAIYIVLGGALGYFAFRRGLPLRPASALYPLIGDRIHGPVGNAIDVLAVFGTLFGLATSLGLGAGQIATGLNLTFGTPGGVGAQVVVIAVLTLVALASVMLGIDKGIRRLSLFNMYGAMALALIVLIVGPTLIILQSFAGALGNYLQTLPQTSLQMFLGNGAAQSWQQDWTIFYWGWWISWSPFVGMFIARISYGITLRKFIAGAMIAPTLVSMVWFSIFGGGGLHYIVEGNQAIANADSTSALFTFMDALPVAGTIATLLSLLGIVVVAVFFATSSDSGSLVVDILTNGGDPNPDWRQRMFWAVTEGAVAAILLIAGAAAGGDPLSALQTASVAAGLPFSVVLIFVCWGLLKSLSEEKAPGNEPSPQEPGRAARPSVGGASRPSPASPHQVRSSSENPSDLGRRGTTSD